MKRKGFTLIELLAVIVILAIIALIATPIVLDIIENSKDSSNKRSIELYGSAVEQAVAKAKLNGNTLPSGKYTTTDGKTLKQGNTTLKVDYDGSKTACDVIISTKGNIYLENCKVNDKATEYTYGKEEDTKTIYRLSTDTINIGDTIDVSDTTKYTTDPSTLSSPYYLKHVLDEDNKVTESYACTILKGGEYCLTNIEYGWSENESDYTGNMLNLKKIQEVGIDCYFYVDGSGCIDAEKRLNIYSDSVSANDGTSISCSVYADGSSSCFY